MPVDRSARRRHGAYYTPALIVDHVVERTLGPLFDGREPTDLLRLRVLDPACGPGAFLAGIERFVRSRVHDSGLADALLRQMVCGVDIDHDAVAAARAHQPLARLARGNFLVGPEWLRAHPEADGADRARVAPLDLECAFPDVFDRAGGGFDAIVGNPPYLREMTDLQPFRDVRGSASERYYRAKMDYWTLFACRSLDLLRSGGRHAFVVPANWTTQAGAATLRRKLLAEAELESVFDFGARQVFDDALVHCMVYVARKVTGPRSHPLRVQRVTDAALPVDELAEALQTGRATPGVELFDGVLVGDARGFRLLRAEERQLLDHLEAVGTARLGRDEIGQGLIAPQERVLARHLARLPAGVQRGDGIFVLSDGERRALDLGEEEALLRPFLVPADVCRHVAVPGHGHWVLYVDRERAGQMEGHPATRAHLDRFAPVITSHNGPYGLHRARRASLFEGPRILGLRKTLRPHFSYCDFPACVSQAFVVLQPADVDPLALTGLLNSAVVHYWLDRHGKKQGDHLQVDVGPLRQLPLVRDLPAELGTLVGRLGALITSSREAAAIRTAIDRLAYGCYRLSPEQIATIEAGVR